MKGRAELVNPLAPVLAVLMAMLPGAALAGVTDLSPMLQKLVQQHQLPGAAGLIIHGDDVVAIGCAGVRKAGDPALFTQNDLIHLGSDTKAMTALLIGRLVDQGKLRLDDTMERLFPDLAGKIDAVNARVTITDLLDHTAGLPHDLQWRELDHPGRPLMQQRRLALELALTRPPAMPVGKYSYSNVGYVLLGAIAEAKMNKPWEDLLKQEIFQPLGMQTGGFGIPGAIGQVDQPWGHLLQNGHWLPLQSDNPPVMAPAGEVHCTITDWGHFASEVLASVRGHPRLLSSSTARALFSVRPGEEYAGGWIITHRNWAGGEALTHSGSNTTWFCTAWIAPAKNFGVLLVTNGGAESVGKVVDEGISQLIDINSNIKAE